MTLFHYIGADRELMTGDFGEVFTWQRLGQIPKPEDPTDLRNILDLSDLEDTLVKVYETELDATYVSVMEVSDPSHLEGHLNRAYIYELHGSFCLRKQDRELSPNDYAANLKCFNELVSYLRDQLAGGESVDIYSCWSGEEAEPLKDQISYRLGELKQKDEFILKDKQLVTIIMPES